MNSGGRRAFLRQSLNLAGLLVAVGGTPRLLRAAEAESALVAGQIGSVLRFDAEGLATLLVPTPDMGQGMITTAAQILADELDLDLNQVTVQLMDFVGEFGEDDRATSGNFEQGAGGSLSVMTTWVALRRAGAYARARIVDAAAAHWQTPRSQLHTEGGQVHNRRTGQSLPYAAFVAAASAEHGTLHPYHVEPKPLSELKRVGRPQGNVHARKIATGQALYSTDLKVPGMLHAVIRRCPHLKGELVGFDASKAEAMPGVVQVVEIKRAPEDLSAPRLRAAGVAVVARSHWQALQAARALEITWDGSLAVADDSDQLRERCLQSLSDGDFEELHRQGEVEAALESSAHSIDSIYFHPHWAHACMEPNNAIVEVASDRATVWAGHQSIPGAINAVSSVTDLKPQQVDARVQRMGCGFGRKYGPDFVSEAALLASAVGAPVKLQWTREDDFEHDYYNPMGAYRVRAGIDREGNLRAWHLRVASDARYSVAPQELPIGLVDASLGETLQIPTQISRGAWRGPQHNTAGWVIQSALDELAERAGIDRLEFLIRLYSGKAVLRSPNWPNADIRPERHVALLRKVAAESGWGKPLGTGRGRGIAVHQTFHSCAAHVVEVQMRGERDFEVLRVTSAIDCGLAVNPLGVKAQVEGGVIDGICAAKYGEMRFANGVPVSSNFDRYRKLRLAEAPREIDVHILDSGDMEPRGTGETALPPVIPALTNAIYAASGHRVRRLPIMGAHS
ncbi:MAG: xanthine dehydrogenase family protein molybdopterin-binding subunit [Xanthomonadales bacterium]|nr:xanthine dehydrogenase family protein molybdopterin-binding subunit [Xanthomonadales bacterium]